MHRDGPKPSWKPPSSQRSMKHCRSRRGSFQRFDANDVLKQNFARIWTHDRCSGRRRESGAGRPGLRWILRRARRRRFCAAGPAGLTEAHRFPAEMVVPLLIAAVAALLLLAQ